MLNTLTGTELTGVGGGSTELVLASKHSDLSLHYAWGRSAYASSPAASGAAGLTQPEPRIVCPF